MLTETQMENEHINRSNNNGYKGKRTEGGVHSQGQTGRKNYGNRSASGNNKPDNGYRKNQKPYQSKNSSDGQNYKKHSYNGNRTDAYSKDKYDDEYDRGNKHEIKKRTSVAKDKTKEIQPDKADIAMRLEKEKKVMQKKRQDNKKNHQQQRPQMKAKRQNNIDWTREYENDSYDDDDMSYYY